MSVLIDSDWFISVVFQDLLEVIESTKKLKEAQAREDSPEAKATLPTLSVADLDREVKRIPIEVSEVQGVEVVKHDVPSSGEQSDFQIVYIYFLLFSLSFFGFFLCFLYYFFQFF